jgi:hypothetical protein
MDSERYARFAEYNRTIDFQPYLAYTPNDDSTTNKISESSAGRFYAGGRS